MQLLGRQKIIVLLLGLLCACVYGMKVDFSRLFRRPYIEKRNNHCSGNPCDEDKPMNSNFGMGYGNQYNMFDGRYPSGGTGGFQNRGVMSGYQEGGMGGYFKGGNVGYQKGGMGGHFKGFKKGSY